VKTSVILCKRICINKYETHHNTY